MTIPVATRSLLVAGVLGPPVFVIVFLVEGATRAGYDPIRQYVSLLALGPGGWLQSGSFVLAGLLVVAAGLGLRRQWAALASRAARWAPWLVVGAGIGLAWCGVFAGDPAQGYPAGAPQGLPTDASWHAGLHYLGATVVFLGLPAAIATASAMPSMGRWWAWSSRAAAATMVGAWLATFLLPGTYGVSDIAGLLQRIAVVAGLGWLTAASIRELDVQQHAPHPAPAAAARLT